MSLVIFMAVIAAIMITIILIACSFANNGSSQHIPNSTTLSSQVNRIEECQSVEDNKYSLSREEYNLIKIIEQNREKIKTTLKAANLEIDTAWMDSSRKIMEITSNLDKNIQWYIDKNLNRAKFNYYISLHYRSFSAADIFYTKQFVPVCESYQKITELIDFSYKYGNQTGVSIENLKETQNILESVRKRSLAHLHQLNNQTRKLKFKIRDECGQRGRNWYESIVKKNRRLQNKT
ncbi:hypothetical protein [Allobaculum sp. JKK-2023]|uniref:hypothetical protein n=1 Tax=Allobaculum sp. JKK-2023 TaxID=3108943 RepID=UPI002B05B3C5|nr:hypothetical protein [Allobaculum sp. JKK-2023]